MNEDLKWLAENVHEWDVRFDRAARDGKYPEWFNAKYFHAGKIGYTRAQWQAARDELSGKPSWDDAPEWAQWLAQDESGRWSFYETKPIRDDEEWFCKPRVMSGRNSRHAPAGKDSGKALGDWCSTLERRPENHSVDATEKVWRGPEDGLPPVGMECEFRHPDFGWTGCTVVGHFRHEAICAPNGGNYYGGTVEEFRPIRSEEDRAVYAMSALLGFPECHATKQICRRLYRAGYRKQEAE